MDTFWKLLIGCFVICHSFNFPLTAQKRDPSEIRKLIEKYKTDARGPYKDIRWFCPDGSLLPPQERCNTPGGVQRARYKDEVVALSKSNHIFLGQILSTTTYFVFWDTANYNSRLKQYQLEKYLKAIDGGWVLQKGQFYRGAFQAEDEEAWGVAFFHWLLSNDENIKKHFFLIRQAAMDVPHRGDDSRSLNVRAISKAISEEYAPFMDLRVKIHGQPQAIDLDNVIAFLDKHRGKLKAGLIKKFEELISDMKIIYQPVDQELLNQYINQLPKDNHITLSLTEFIRVPIDSYPKEELMEMLAYRIWEIRQGILEIQPSGTRLALLDLSLILEQIFFREMNSWEPGTLHGLLNKIYYISMVAAGTGFLEPWEWEIVSRDLGMINESEIELQALTFIFERSRSLLEWSVGMAKAVFKDVVGLYGPFEPLANGFIDDRVRGSVLLPLGRSIGLLGDYLAREAELKNHVFDMPNQSHVRGLNPGYALGELIVVSDNSTEIDVRNDKIYVFLSAPADLKPVAGIATVTEGNLVSHVQLLARNLGIPNAVISQQNMEYLKNFDGQLVFYAVSHKGNVIMKPDYEMTLAEKQLFVNSERSADKIYVPTEKINLGLDSIISLRAVDATSSGKICGPKAANLGQLKKMYPGMVVEGLVIPFGIFKKHMDQEMDGQETTYWKYLEDVFKEALLMQQGSQEEAEIEEFLLRELSILHVAITKMKLLPQFESDLRESFSHFLGKKMGTIPVFLRSDTNMEDLDEFTGAGLNLTLFNVVSEERIIQGIKDVWASPYTERSFKWRQRFLLNPENVFPSILIIPSVDVDCSGVVITKGISTGNADDLTLAFNRGAGGAVEGQAAESYLLLHNGEDLLLSPAREPQYRTLPEKGGVKINLTTFDKPILTPENLQDLRKLSGQINIRLPQARGIEVQGPFDIELGFKGDEMWLFQVRPFVENKNAAGSEYLESITPLIPDKMICLSEDL